MQRGLFFVIATGLLIISPLAYAEEMTRLRADSPAGEFVTARGVTRLSKVEITVRNVGEALANEVKVKVLLPDGSTEEAYGPKSLEPKATATYTTYPNDYITSDKRIRAEVTCSNCYH